MQHIGFTKNERIGIAFLLVLFTLYLGISHLYNGKQRRHNIPNIDSIFHIISTQTEATMEQNQSFETQNIQVYKIGNKPGSESKTKKNPGILNCVPFDPNTITKEELIQFGIRARTAHNWTAYRAAGARFYSPEDLLRVFGIDSAIVRQLDGCLQFGKRNQNNIKTDKKTRETPSIVDLNTADTTALQALPGIGRVLSSRIIKYRNLLGGYHAKEQLLEVYGLQDDNYRKCAPFIEIATPHECIEIDLGIQSLPRHPYINKQMGKTILAFIENHGIPKDPNEILALKELPDRKKELLLPYLCFEGALADTIR